MATGLEGILVTRFIDGPYDGADVCLAALPPHVTIGGELYARVVDPDTEGYSREYVHLGRAGNRDA